MLGTGGGLTTPAAAAGAVSITVTSAPNSVAAGQAIVYTINAVNTGGSTAAPVGDRGAA